MNTLANRFLSLLFLGTAAVVVYLAAGTFTRDLAFTELETEVSFWGRGEYHPEVATVEGVSRSLESLLQLRPSHPDFLALQASVFAWQAYWSKGSVAADSYAIAAVDAQHASLVSRPAFLPGWGNLATYAARVQGQEDLIVLAKSRAGGL